MAQIRPYLQRVVQSKSCCRGNVKSGSRWRKKVQSGGQWWAVVTAALWLPSAKVVLWTSGLMGWAREADKQACPAENETAS